MPPPNQTTGAPPAGNAASMRTFMCTVGTYGLRGWKTSETPIASNGASASSAARCCVAAAGSARPLTCEKPQPPRSSSAPPSTRREMPSPSSAPPGSRCQASTRNGVAALLLERGDDARLQAEQVRAHGGGVDSGRVQRHG